MSEHRRQDVLTPPTGIAQPTGNAQPTGTAQPAGNTQPASGVAGPYRSAPTSSPAPARRRDLRPSSTTPPSAPLTRRELRAGSTADAPLPAPAPSTRRELRANDAGQAGKTSKTSETAVVPTTNLTATRRDLRSGKPGPVGKGGRFGAVRYVKLMSPIGVAAGIVAMVAAVTLLFTNGGLIGGGATKISNASSSEQAGNWWNYRGRHHDRHPDNRNRHPYPAPSLATTSPSAPASTPAKPTGSKTSTTSAIPVKPPAVQPPGGQPVSSGYPDSSNTGVQKGVSLDSRSGTVTVSQSNSTVSNLDISGGLVVRGNNITIKNVRVRCGGVSDFCVQLDGSGDVLSYTEVGGGSNGSTYTNAIGIWAGGDSGNATETQIIATDVHNTSDGMRIDGYTTVRDSYVHQLMYTGGVHSDGVQSTSGPNMVYKHNTFVGGTNCTLFLQPTGDQPISNVVVDQNQFIGEARDGSVTSYGLCVDPRVKNVSVTNNRFSRTGWQVAPASQNFAWSTWSGNGWTDGSSLAKP